MSIIRLKMLDMDMFTILPHNRVIFPNIFCYLSLEDIFRIRQVSKRWNAFVKDYFDSSRTLQLDDTMVGNEMSPESFQLMTQNRKDFRSLLLANKWWLSNNLLIPVIDRCSNLSVVDLSYCSQLNNQIIVVLARKCTSLTQLSLELCKWVKKKSLEKLVKKNRHLTKLNVSGCIQLDAESIKVVCNYCQQLQELEISFIDNIYDSTLIYVARHCPSLIHLSVIDCFGITNAGVRAVVKGCKQFRSLDVFWNTSSNITKEYLMQLQDQGIRVME